MLKVYKTPENKENEALTDQQKRFRIRELRKLITGKDINVKFGDGRETETNARTDDLYLIRWLNCRDWDVHAAFRRRIKHYNFRKNHSDWYPWKKFLDYEPILQKDISFMLDGRDKNGRRVYLARANRINLDEYTMEEKIQMDTLWFDMVCEELETIKNGVTVLIDMKGVTWSTVKWFLNQQNMKIASRYAGFTPLKYVEIHVVNTSSICNLLIAVSFPFLSEGLKERIHFHRSNMRSLHKYLGRDVLPKEYGGEKKLNFRSIYSRLYEAYKCQPSKKKWFYTIREEEKDFGKIENILEQ